MVVLLLMPTKSLVHSFNFFFEAVYSFLFSKLLLPIFHPLLPSTISSCVLIFSLSSTLLFTPPHNLLAPLHCLHYISTPTNSVDSYLSSPTSFMFIRPVSFAHSLTHSSLSPLSSSIPATSRARRLLRARQPLQQRSNTKRSTEQDNEHLTAAHPWSERRQDTYPHQQPEV